LLKLNNYSELFRNHTGEFFKSAKKFFEKTDVEKKLIFGFSKNFFADLKNSPV
jgi:hypothetical protein